MNFVMQTDERISLLFGGATGGALQPEKGGKDAVYVLSESHLTEFNQHQNAESAKILSQPKADSAQPIQRLGKRQLPRRSACPLPAHRDTQRHTAKRNETTNLATN